jgi:hypothetical protein
LLVTSLGESDRAWESAAVEDHHMSDELLFNEYEIFGVLQNQPAAVKKRIQAILAATLLNASEHNLLQALIDEFRLNVPAIDDDRIYIAESGEAQIDVSGDPMRMIYDRTQAFYIPGNKTVIAVPFEGDVEFFRVRPSSFSVLRAQRLEKANSSSPISEQTRTPRRSSAITSEP